MPSLSEEILKAVRPFNRLGKRRLGRFISCCREVEYSSHQVIYEEGAPPDKFYLLLKGRLVALSRQDGRDVEIELIKRGTPFGVISLLTSEPHSVTVRSIEPSLVLEMDKDHFRDFLTRNPLLALDFSRILSRKVKKRAGQPKTIFQSLKVGICSFLPQQRTTAYMIDLARALRRETGKEIVVIQCSFSKDFILPKLLRHELKAAQMTRFREDELSEFIVKGEIDSLCVHLDRASIERFFSLVNYLSENYHFLFYEFPLIDDDESRRLIIPADRLHFISSSEKEDWEKVHQLLKRSHQKVIPQIRCLLARDDLETAQVSSNPFYSLLPRQSSPGYFQVLSRTSRELGEKTVGLVLGSGAAFGLAHIGVLKVLEQEGVAIDIISGSSMGALIGALWGLGYSISEIEEIALSFGRKLLFASFASFAFPFKGFLKSRQLEKLLKDLFEKKSFSDLRRRVRVCTFDFLKREPHIIEEGALYKAIAASCAMPGVFEPITYKEEIFLDGGILAPLPVNTVLDYAKKIIAVNVTPSREEIMRDYALKGKPFTILDYIFGSIETMQREFIHEAQKSADVVIHPDMKGLSWVEFTKVKEFLKRGESATEDMIEDIRALIRG